MEGAVMARVYEVPSRAVVLYMRALKGREPSLWERLAAWWRRPL